MTPLPDPPKTIADASSAEAIVGVPSLKDIWQTPLPGLDGRWLTRWICRSLVSLSRRRVLAFTGLEHISSHKDPFILALNHSQKPEAILVPTWLCFHRGGRMVHFMADWNFLLLPIIGTIIRLHDPIVVVRKDAKPAILNRLKPWFQSDRSPLEAAADRLRAGQSIGVFPEGTVNRHPQFLLRGQRGVARLSWLTQVPVVPGGIRFPRHFRGGPISDREPLSVHLGPPITPPPRDREFEIGGETFHQQIMCAISTLSGKEWQPDSRRTKYAFRKA